jgi:hypothetical protein
MKSPEKMTLEERKATLIALQLSTPEILDHLIQIHRDALAHTKPDNVTRFWQTVLTDLLDLRNHYRAGG